MMRGPSYDDSYITRKMSSLNVGPSYVPAGPASYGRPPMGGYMQPDVYDYGYMPRAYPPMGPPRIAPRLAPPPAYYDYDYGYGGGYGGGYCYAPPPPLVHRLRYDYPDDEVDMSYTPRYRPRVTEPQFDEQEYKDKSAEKGGEEGVVAEPTPRKYRTSRFLKKSSQPSVEKALPESEGERHLARLSHRYPSLSDTQALQDHVDKMRIRLKSLAYSLDPSGPVPEIVIPTRAKKTEVTGTELSKKYTAGVDYNELPRLSTRRTHYYPEDEHMKDNLRIKCLSHYKTTRTAAESQMRQVLPDSYTSKYTARSASKWEEPDTVYGSTTDRKPYSKVETGSSFFSTYGYTNRMKDTVGEKVRDYYYGVSTKTDAEPAVDDEARKERRKKKKSKERDDAGLAAIEAAPFSESVVIDAILAVDAEPVIADGEEAIDESLLDEKERKRLEKKKRKAEREAAAKAAMEAELAALAAAEAELARLEAESASLKPSDDGQAEEATEAPAALEVPAPEGTSESAAEKSVENPVLTE